MTTKSFSISTLRLTGIATAVCLFTAPLALADTAIHGSVRLPSGMTENPHANKAQRATEAKRLAHYAKLTPEQAITAARTIAKGKVNKLVLENEDGFLAYAVFLGGHEVLVDAGNGKILGDERESPNTND